MAGNCHPSGSASSSTSKRSGSDPRATRARTAALPRSRRGGRAALAALAFAHAFGAAPAFAAKIATPAPESFPSATPGAGPARDLEAGRLLAQLAQATDDAAVFDRAVRSGFASRALDRLDADAAAAGDARLFGAVRAAFAATATPASRDPSPLASPAAAATPSPAPPAVALEALARASQRYLARLAPRSARVTLFADLVAQIGFNASVLHDDRADALERATLATIDDADSLAPLVGVERQSLLDVPDGAWRAIARSARVLEASLGGVGAARDTPTPPPAVAPPSATAAPKPLRHSVAP